ncbi:MAG: hypothetical protein ABR541_06250, partial [Candidatus Dormibacteria bacterium]
AIVDGVNLLAATTRHLHLTSVRECHEAVASLDGAIAALGERRSALLRAAGAEAGPGRAPHVPAAHQPARNGRPRTPAPRRQ